MALSQPRLILGRRPNRYQAVQPPRLLVVARGEREACDADRTHWLIGRMSAECAFCATALPLAEASMRSHNGPVVIQHKNRDAHAWAA